MSNLEMVEFKPEHAAELSSRSIEPLEVSSEYILNMATQWKSSGPSISVFFDDTLIASGGITVLWPGVGQAWVFLDRDTIPSILRREAFSIPMEYIARWVKEYNLHRLQALVRCDFKQGLRYASHLGFVVEGTLKFYDSLKNDYYMMRRM